MNRGLSPAHYYLRSVSLEHATGDIWNDLPTMGMLRGPTCAGLVITPACDLAQQKTETLTYLPIVPVLHWFLSTAFFAEMRRILKDLACEQLKIDLPREFHDSPSPDPAHLPELRRRLGEFQVAKDREKDLIGRCREAVDHLEAMADGSTLEVDLGRVERVLGGKKYREVVESLVRNRRADLHFLPSDALGSPLAGLPSHSLVLLRFPQTAPIEIFDLAQDEARRPDWEAGLRSLAGRFPAAAHFAAARPIKVLRLEREFLGDALTRFVGLFVRLGSADFSSGMIDRICREAGGAPR